MSKYRKFYFKAARLELIKNENLKEELRRLTYHFKYNGWPLMYQQVFYDSKLNNNVLFNSVLELKGYKISYSKARMNFMITKDK